MNRRERRAQTKADPRLSGSDVRYGGRTLQVTAYVNTDEDERVVALRVQEAAKGPGKRMVLVTAGILNEEQSHRLWHIAAEAAADTVEKEPQA